jgi:membrane associated rhomboid family serine protease
MAYRTSSFGAGFGALGGGMTPWVRRLLIANTAIYLLIALSRFLPGLGTLLGALALRPAQAYLAPWSLITYAFLHASLFHLLGNLLVLYFFGPRLEEHWGSRGFIQVYLIAAAGGAVASILLLALAPAGMIVGASGAVLGLLLAYALLWPDQEVHIWGIFPLRVKWLVAIIAGINLMMAVEGSGGGIAWLAHLGGMAAAFLWLRSPWAPRGWGSVPTPARQGAGGRSPGATVAAWLGRARGSGPRPVDRRPTPVAPKARTRRAERELLDDIDRILDKISDHGMQSLTPEERSRLDEVSRNRRSN